MKFGSSIISTAFMILFILDPFGNVPVILSIIKDIDKKRQKKLILRELLIGLGILIFFLLFGRNFLNLFHLETNAVRISGAIILFMIAIRFIFPNGKGTNVFNSGEEPFIVPIAIPMIAGPSALATLMVLSQSGKQPFWATLTSLLIAWTIAAIILIFSPVLFKILRKKGLMATERLMGMLLLIMSVQMFIDGVKQLLQYR